MIKRRQVMLEIHDTRSLSEDSGLSVILMRREAGMRTHSLNSASPGAAPSSPAPLGLAPPPGLAPLGPAPSLPAGRGTPAPGRGRMGGLPPDSSPRGSSRASV